MARRFSHCTVAVVLVALWFCANARDAVAQAPGEGPAQLLVFIHGTALGSEESTLRRTASGWTITGSNRLSPPLDLTTRRFSMTYQADWRPTELVIEAMVRGTALNIRTTFAGTTASSEISQLSQPTTKTDQVTADTLVLPNLFFSAYEALAMRLAASTGDTVRMAAYIAPQAEIALDATRLEPQVIETQHGTVRASRFSITFHNMGNPVASELWADESGRLLRFEVQAQGLVVIREDIATVAARRQNITRAGDEGVRIPGNGFTIAGTVSRPSGEPDRRGRYPAVVLVPGSGAVDRDETVAGIPIFGQLANALADAGFVVLRYDKRGVGQTGGRMDTATIEDAAEDALAIVRFLGRRRNVDRNRIVVFGHSEGALVALQAGARQRGIAALVLAAAPSGTGAELILEQQDHLLQQMSLPEAERQKRVELQQRVHAAVLGEGEWEGVPEELRRQADTPWFASFLAFSPAKVMSRVRQPILVLHGELDRQVAPHHAAKLEALAKDRKRPAVDPVRVAMLPGVNHLLVPARTGEVAEYGTLAEREVTPEVTKVMVEWLKGVFEQRR